MIQLDAHKSVHFCDGLKRRDFLHAGALGFLGLSLGDLFALQAAGLHERRRRQELHHAVPRRRARASSTRGT